MPTLNLDTASATELRSITGVGEKAAQEIIKFRDDGGTISTWRTFHKLAPQVTFNELASLHMTNAWKSSIKIFQLRKNIDLTNENSVSIAILHDGQLHQDEELQAISRDVRQLREDREPFRMKMTEAINDTKDSIQRVADKLDLVAKNLNDRMDKYDDALSRICDTVSATDRSNREVVCRLEAVETQLHRMQRDVFDTQFKRMQDSHPFSESQGVPTDGAPKDYSFNFGEAAADDRIEGYPGGSVYKGVYKRHDSKRSDYNVDEGQSHKQRSRAMDSKSHGDMKDIRLAGIGRGNAQSNPRRSAKAAGQVKGERSDIVRRESFQAVASKHSSHSKFYEDEDSSDSFHDYSADEDEDNRQPHGYSMDARNIRMDPFEGHLGEWDDWFHKFKFIARNCQWTNREKLFRLTTALKGTALTAHRNLPIEERNNFNSLCKAMRRRYGKARRSTKASLRAQLSSITQRETEDLDCFADRVLALITDAYPKDMSKDHLDIYAVDAFIAGCKDRKAALLASTHAPDTLFDAVEQMKLIQANGQRLGIRLDSRYVDFESPSRDVEVAKVRSLRKSDGDTCHTCGGKGH